VEDTYGLSKSDAHMNSTITQKPTRQLPDSIILEEAHKGETMLRKATIDFPKYSKTDSDYLKFVVESTPRKIFPVKDVY
jgi:hypothetical protein